MTDRPDLHFQVSYRSSQDGADAGSVLGELNNLGPALENLQRQGSVSLPQWLRFQQQEAALGSRNAGESVREEQPGGGSAAQAPSQDEQPLRQRTTRTTSNPLSNLYTIVNQYPDLSRAITILIACLPFFVIVLLKEIYEHLLDLFMLVGLVITLLHASGTVEREVSNQNRRKLKPLIISLLNCHLSLMLLQIVYEDQQLYRSVLLYPRPPSVISLPVLLWTNITIDLVLKLLTVSFKAILVAFPMSYVTFPRRGRYLDFMEKSSQLYRALATVPPWIHYLYYDRRNPTMNKSDASDIWFWNHLVGSIFCAGYVLCKAYRSYETLKTWQASLNYVFQTRDYGQTPNAQQLQSAGPTCPICHDEFKRPTYLQCRHIFCEECLTVWLEREPTCPLCRARVVEDLQWKDGGIDPFIQIF